MVKEVKNFEQVQNQFWNSMYKFGEQLESIAEDMKSMEIITGVGTTTLKFKSVKQGIDAIPIEQDITALANSNENTTEIIDGNITVLARTRFELDGDLLVILPTLSERNKVKTSTSSPSSSTGTAGSPGSSTGTAGSPGSSADTSTNSSNDAFEIDTEILELHKQNVDMALKNLQFVYGKAMELLTNITSDKSLRSRLGF